MESQTVNIYYKEDFLFPYFQKVLGNYINNQSPVIQIYNDAKL